MKIDAQLHYLLSTPALLTETAYTVSDSEREFIDGQGYAQNSGGNLTSTDRFILESKQLAGIKSFIDAALRFYVDKVLHWKSENEIYVTQSWINKNPRGTAHTTHTHPNSYLSGVFYLTEDPSPTVFTSRANPLFILDMDTTENNEFNERYRKVSIKPDYVGQLLLFPSTVEHYVPSNGRAADRMTLSFNTFVRGVAGNNQNITYLELL